MRILPIAILATTSALLSSCQGQKEITNNYPKAYLPGILMQSTFCENYYKGDDGKTLSTQLPCTLNGIKGVDDSIGISWAEGKEGFMEILAFKEGGMLYVSDTDNPSDIKEGSYKVTKEGLKVTYPFEGELEDILIPINPLFSWQR